MTALDLGRALRPHPNWEWDAACKNEPFELFFGGPERPLTHSSGTAGQAICLKCSVRRDCLLWALLVKEPSGMWGGYLAHERRAALARCAGSVEAAMADYDEGVFYDHRRRS